MTPGYPRPTGSRLMAATTGLDASRRWRRACSTRLADHVLKVRVAALSPEERFASANGEDSRTIRHRVAAARELQARRYKGTAILVNARLRGRLPHQAGDGRGIGRLGRRLVALPGESPLMGLRPHVRSFTAGGQGRLTAWSDHQSGPARRAH